LHPMRRLRTRKSFVFLAIGLVLFATFVPAAAANLPVAILAPLWLIPPTVAITLIRREASRCDDQPASLLALVASRAPPSTLAFA
jgi:hypothetical protein